jgi:type IV secretion system protein VirD4
MSFSRSMLMLAVLSAAYCLLIVAAEWPLAIVGIITVSVFLAKRGHRRLTTLGSARWAESDDVIGMLYAKNGLILGRLSETRRRILPAIRGLFNWRIDSLTACLRFLIAFEKPGLRLVRLNDVHTAVFAKTSAGKGVSLVIPFLQTCTDSCVVVDFKGELARLTAEHRRAMGHDVRIVDPYMIVTNAPDQLNPLDGIERDSPIAVDDCRDLANAMVIRTGEEKDPHWVDSAETWISAILAAVAYFGEPGDRSLQTAQTLLSNPAKLAAIIDLMRESPQVWSGMLARMGNQLVRFKDTELASCLTTVGRFMKFLDTIAVASNTKESTFDPADLMTRKMTAYLVLPPEHVRAQQALLRLWIGTMLRACVKGGLQEENLVHFVLDEAATLGHMDAIDDAVDKYRGYGVRLQFYFQSLAQLRKCFPDGQDQNLLSNCSQVYFAVNDRDTAQYVSDRLGDATIVVGSGGISRGTTRQRSPMGQTSVSESFTRNDNWAPQARRLLKPEEVTALSGRLAITFTPGAPPVLSRLIRYYEEKLKPVKRSRTWEKVGIFSCCLWFLAVGLFMAAGLTVIVNDQWPMPAYRVSQFRFEDFGGKAPRQTSKMSIRQSGEGRRAVDQRWRGTESIPEGNRRSDTTEDEAQWNDDGD